MAQAVRLINHIFWFPGGTETELSKNSTGCAAHGNLFPGIKEKYSAHPGPNGMIKGIPQAFADEMLPGQDKNKDGTS